MADLTTETEVEGSIVAVVHVDESGTDPVRTVLALATKDGLSVTIDEDNEDFSPGSMRRDRRYRTNNTIDLEVATAVSTDQEALELLGIVDTDGKIDFASDSRKIEAPDAYLEFAYFVDEPDFSSADVPTDSELLNRFEDVEITSPDIDPSATPPTVSFTGWVEGDMWFHYTPSS